MESLRWCTTKVSDMSDFNPNVNVQGLDNVTNLIGKTFAGLLYGHLTLTWQFYQHHLKPLDFCRKGVIFVSDSFVSQIILEKRV